MRTRRGRMVPLVDNVGDTSAVLGDHNLSYPVVALTLTAILLCLVCMEMQEARQELAKPSNTDES